MTLIMKIAPLNIIICKYLYIFFSLFNFVSFEHLCFCSVCYFFFIILNEIKKTLKTEKNTGIKSCNAYFQYNRRLYMFLAKSPKQYRLTEKFYMIF